MVKHIEFCLDEIECEIEALEDGRLAAPLKAGLRGNIASMRAILDAARPSAELASDTTPIAAPRDVALAIAGDDFTRIRGVTAADAAWLARNGIHTFATIAGWRRANIEALGGGKALRQRIAQENWIEQAAVLATGRQTAYAAALDGGTSAEVSPVAAMAAAIAAAMGERGATPGDIGTGEADPEESRSIAA